MGTDDLFRKRQSQTSLIRKEEIREERQSFWIICEGESEQSYLESLYSKKLHFCFSACLDTIKSKIIEKSEAKHIFVLLDMDIHEEVEIENFCDYCKLYPNVTVIANSPCFEYWLLLHFEYTTKSFMGNNQGRTKDNECEKYLKKVLKKHSLTYKKGKISGKLLKKLKESHPQAIANAKKTSKERENSGTSSYSEMHKLFEWLKAP